LKNTKHQMTTKQNKTSTAKRLSAYSTIAAATAVGAGSANAANVYWDIDDLSSDGSANKIWFNMPEGSAGLASSPTVDEDGEFRFYKTTSSSYGFIGQAPGAAGGFAGTISSSSGYVTPTALTSGASVSGGLTFGAYASTSSAWAALDDFDGYLGLQFEISGETHYGWAEISSNATSLSLKSFGYNTTADEAATPNLAVNQIPEPSSLALLALGATGLMRRRRQKAA
jgi:hypothetical protein